MEEDFMFLLGEPGMPHKQGLGHGLNESWDPEVGARQEQRQRYTAPPVETGATTPYLKVEEGHTQLHAKQRQQSGPLPPSISGMGRPLPLITMSRSVTTGGSDSTATHQVAAPPSPAKTSDAGGAGRSAVRPGEALPASQNWPMDLPPMPGMPEMPPFGSAYMGNPESMAFPDATQEARPISSRSFGLPSGSSAGMAPPPGYLPHCRGQMAGLPGSYPPSSSFAGHMAPYFPEGPVLRPSDLGERRDSSPLVGRGQDDMDLARFRGPPAERNPSDSLQFVLEPGVTECSAAAQPRQKGEHAQRAQTSNQAGAAGETAGVPAGAGLEQAGHGASLRKGSGVQDASSGNTTGSVPALENIVVRKRTRDEVQEEAAMLVGLPVQKKGKTGGSQPVSPRSSQEDSAEDDPEPSPKAKGKQRGKGRRGQSSTAAAVAQEAAGRKLTDVERRRLRRRVTNRASAQRIREKREEQLNTISEQLEGDKAALFSHVGQLKNCLEQPTTLSLSSGLQVVQLEGDKAALVKHVGQLEECCSQLTDQLKDVKGKWASSCMSSVKLHKEMQELRRLTGPQTAPGGELWSVPQYSGGSMGQAKHDLAVQVPPPSDC